MPVMVKHIRSLRSQLCKVAILCFGDVVTVVHDAALPHVERDAGAGLAAPAGSALCQLLLKSVSKEKMFVVAAAREVLRTCTRCLDPRAMLVRLVPYTQHKCAPALLLHSCVCPCLARAAVQIVPSLLLRWSK